jgi:lipopolysaccharide export system protein LptC
VDERKEVQTDGLMTLKGPQISLEGQGMVMNLESQKVKVKSKARMTFYQAFFAS